jgi:hypothetical protein
MKTKDIIDLDYREEENKVIIQNVLRQLKPLSKYSDEEDIPLVAIEKAIKIMCSRYLVRIRSIWPDIWANKKSDIWRADIVNDSNLMSVGVVYGISIYEVFAKIAILIYSEIKKERLEVRK